MRKMQSDTDNVDALPSGIQVTTTLLNSDATISCPLEPGGGGKRWVPLYLRLKRAEAMQPSYCKGAVNNRRL